METTAELYTLGFSRTLARRIAAKITVTDTGCHEWQAARLPSGYGRIGRGQKHRGVELAHRAVWMLHHGPIADGLVVRHSCDNPPCCNIEHLSIGTTADNQRDMRERGRANYVRGERHCSARLTDATVAEIRNMAPTIGNDAEVGRLYGISKQYARTLRLGLGRAA